jgi:hypothetical protein
MPGVFASQDMKLAFADFKCAIVTYDGTPDIAGLREPGQLVFIGELKVPWVPQHSLDQAVKDKDGALRKVLGWFLTMSSQANRNIC